MQRNKTRDTRERKRKAEAAKPAREGGECLNLYYSTIDSLSSNEVIEILMYQSSGHAHGVGVHPLIINKCPTFSQIFLLWTECKRKQSQS